MDPITEFYTILDNIGLYKDIANLILDYKYGYITLMTINDKQETYLNNDFDLSFRCFGDLLCITYFNGNLINIYHEFYLIQKDLVKLNHLLLDMIDLYRHLAFFEYDAELYVSSNAKICKIIVDCANLTYSFKFMHNIDYLQLDNKYNEYCVVEIINEIVFVGMYPCFGKERIYACDLESFMNSNRKLIEVNITDVENNAIFESYIINNQNKLLNTKKYYHFRHSYLFIMNDSIYRYTSSKCLICGIECDQCFPKYDCMMFKCDGYIKHKNDIQIKCDVSNLDTIIVVNDDVLCIKYHKKLGLYKFIKLAY